MAAPVQGAPGAPLAYATRNVALIAPSCVSTLLPSVLTPQSPLLPLTRVQPTGVAETVPTAVTLSFSKSSQ